MLREKRWLFFVGIKALIVKDRKVLLLAAGPSELSSTQRKEIFWDLPGGKIESGENVEDTLRREVSEELGIEKKDLIINNIFEASVSNFKTSHGVDVPLLLITFECGLRGNGDSFKLTDEHSSFKWFEIDEARKILSVKFNKTFIKKLDSL